MGVIYLLAVPLMLCRARVVLLTNGIDWLNCQHNLMTIFNESVNWARIYVFAPKLPSPAPHAALHPLPVRPP